MLIARLIRPGPAGAAFALVCLAALLACPVAWAQRAPDQFKHLAFPIDRGAPPDVSSLGQGANGDLWIASTSGLFHFDGLRFERFRATGPDQLRSDMIYSMFVDRAGNVWVGYYSGGASVIVNGRVHHFAAGLPKGPLKQFVEDRQGRIWAISVRGIAYFQSGGWHAVSPGLRPEDGTPYTMLVARDGTLWIATGKALLFVRPGRSAIERTSVRVEEAWALAQGPDGRIWLSDEADGTRPIAPRPGTPPGDQGRPASLHGLIARRLMFDRAGNLWAALERQPGIVRVAHPDAVPTGIALAERDVSAWYRQESGLTSDLAAPLFEDRHGIVWAGTRLGVDQFMPVNFLVRPEIAKVPRTGFRAIRAPDGEIALADETGVYLYSPEERLAATIPYAGVARNFCADSRSRIFLGGDTGLVQIAGGAAVPVALPAELRSRVVLGCQFDRAGNLWLLSREHGVFVRRAARWSRVLSPEAIGAASPRLMVIDDRDRLWLGSDGGGVALFARGRLRRFGPAEGLAIGFVQTALPLAEGILFGGELGLARFDGRRFHSLTQRDHPGLSLIAGMARDAKGDLWISGNRGVAVFRDTALPALFGSEGTRKLVPLDFRNGLPGYPQINCCTNTILNARSGHLWFLTNQGVAWLDPAHLDFPSKQVEPIIRAVASGETSLPASGISRLASGYPNLRIDYTSDGLANADQVEFRYRLVGVDDRWIEAGQRRQAFYPALANGRYDFKLQARLPGGEWGTREASVGFVVPPTFLQTPWPAVLALVLAALAIAALYWLRLRHAMELLEKRLEERSRERERIARELHDTLLQSVQALVLRIDLARQEIPPEFPARDELEVSLEQAEKVLAEARDTVRGLRPIEGSDDVEEMLREIARKQAFDPGVSIAISTSGRPRPLCAEVRDETARIANEALFNIWRHAGATHVGIQILFDPARFEVSIFDNGVGIPAEILARGEREGHFGLIGMRERALRLGANLRIASEAGTGTRVTLTVPAATAFAGDRVPVWSRLRARIARLGGWRPR